MEVDNLFLLDFQVFEVAPSLHMVELRKIGGDTLEFHKVRQHSNLDISKKKKKNILLFWMHSFSKDGRVSMR
jgi:hypothetical protein